MFATPSRFQEDYSAKYDEPRHHVEALLNAKIITLYIKPRILYPLDKIGIKTIKQLLELYQKGFKKVPQIGYGAQWELKKILNFHSLTSFIYSDID